MEEKELPLFNTNQKMILVLVAGVSILIGVLIWLLIR